MRFFLWTFFFLIIFFEPENTQSQNIVQTAYQAHPLFFKAIETGSGGNIKKAESMFQHVIEMLPFHIEAQLNIKICQDFNNKRVKMKTAVQLFVFQKDFYDLEDPKYLSKLIGDIIKKNPKYLPAYLLQGNYYYKNKTDSLALYAFDQAILLQSDYAISYLYRGRVHTRLKNINAAIQDFTLCLYYNPKISQALYQRGILYSEQRRFDQAILDFEKAMYIYNDSFYHFKIYEAYINRGTKLLEQHRYKEANSDFEKAIGFDTRFGEVYMNRAMAYKGLQVYDSALVNFNLAEEKGFESQDLYYFRGETYLQLDKKDNALLEFKKASSINENDYRYPYQIAEILIDEQKFSKAEPYLKTVIELQSDKVWAYYLLAFCYDNMKKYNQAVIYYEAFLEIAPESYFRHISHVRKRTKLLRRWMSAQNKN